MLSYGTIFIVKLDHHLIYHEVDACLSQRKELSMTSAQFVKPILVSSKICSKKVELRSCASANIKLYDILIV